MSIYDQKGRIPCGCHGMVMHLLRHKVHLVPRWTAISESLISFEYELSFLFALPLSLQSDALPQNS